MSAIMLGNAAVNGVTLGLLLSLPALAMTLVYGLARFPHIAVGDHLTLGAYTVIAMQVWVSTAIWPAAIVACIVNVAVALLFYGWVFRQLKRRPPVISMIAAAGVAFVIRSTITFFAGHSQYVVETPLVRAWNFGGIRILPTDLYIVLTVIVVLAAVFLLLFRTSLGRQMRAVASNPDLARVSGIRAGPVMIAVYVLFGVLCGLGGVLLGIKAVVFPELGWDLLLPILAAIVLGGIGNPVGAVLGMVAFGVSQELAAALFGSSYKIGFAFFVLLIILLMRPQGLLGKIDLVR